MSCHETLLLPAGLEFESWIGTENRRTDCRVGSDGGERYHYVRVTSYRGDQGVLSLRGTTAFPTVPKQLHFEFARRTAPDWDIDDKHISAFGGFTERARIVVHQKVRSTDTVLAIIKKCDYLRDYSAHQRQVGLDVEL